MVVTKILEGTLPSGNTTLTFTDSNIPNSLIRVYSTNADVYPASLSVSSNTLTITYEAQASTLYVAVELVKEGLEVVDDVITDDATKALSAKQGLYLKGLIDNLGAPSIAELTDVEISEAAEGDILVYNSGDWINMANNITNLNDVEVADIEDGQVLAWDEAESVFKNVDMSGSGSISYSTTESVIGTWVNGKPVYQKTIEFGALPNNTTKEVAHGISNLARIVSLTGAATNTTTRTSIPIPFVHRSTISTQVQIAITDTQIQIVTATNQSAYNETYITLQYTKTTD